MSVAMCGLVTGRLHARTGTRITNLGLTRYLVPLQAVEITVVVQPAVRSLGFIDACLTLACISAAPPPKQVHPPLQTAVAAHSTLLRALRVSAVCGLPEEDTLGLFEQG